MLQLAVLHNSDVNSILKKDVAMTECKKLRTYHGSS